MWIDLPGNIDAAFTGSNGKVYFFKGSQYWRYNGNYKDEDYPRRISRHFPGIPNNINAAMYYPPLQEIYFFKGNPLFGGSKNYHLQMIFVLSDDFPPQETVTGYTILMKHQQSTADIRYPLVILREYPMI